MQIMKSAALAATLTLALLPAARASELTGTLKKIKDTGVITIGYRESSVPFSYLDDNQKPTGFSIDLCSHVVEAVKTALGMPDLKIAYDPVTLATRLPLVANGTVDIECGSTANLIVRQKQVAFSVSTFVSRFKWLVRADSGITKLEDLEGKTVVVTAGTNTSQFLNKFNQSSKLNLSISQAKDHAESFLYVQNARAAAFMEDDVLLSSMRATAKDPAQYKLLDAAYPADPYALMFRRDDPAFKALIDQTLIGLMSSGQFEKLYVKWFEMPIPPRAINLAYPMSDELKTLIKHPSDAANN